MLRFLFVSLLLCCCFACGEKQPETAQDFLTVLQKENPNYIADEFKNKIQSVSFLMKISGKDPEGIRAETSEIYTARKGSPLWQDLDAGTASEQLPELIQSLYDAPQHGFQAGFYNTSTIDTLYRQIYQQKKWKGKEELANKIELDMLATGAIVSFLSDLSAGRTATKWDIESSQHPIDQLVLAKHQNVAELIQVAAPPFKAYKSLQERIQSYEAISKEGGFPEVKNSGLSKGKSGDNVKKLAQRLKLSGDLNGANNGFDDKLEAALKKFQKRHAIAETGKVNQQTLTALNRPLEDVIDQMYLNLERYRWLPDSMGDKYIWVNIPEFQIEVREKDETVMEMRGVVGENITPTPVFSEEMTHLVFSPAWNIPWSIIKEEIYNFSNHNDFPSLLIVSNVEVFLDGKKLDPFSIDWKNITNDKKKMRKYRFRQKPGTDNSLGLVKFIFRNKYAVYLHDTPKRKYFKVDQRALSSGCIRVQKPVELSHYLLKDKGDWSIDRIKSNMGRSSELRVNLTEKIPVYLYYLTSWVDEEGQLQFRKDIYRHDKKQMERVKALRS